MDFEDLLSRLAVALGIGLLVGLERGWTTRGLPGGTRAAGIRTFAITGLLGGILGGIGVAAGIGGGGALIVAFGMLGYFAAITVFAREENISEKRLGATTPVAAMTTLSLGVFAMVGDIRLAAAAAVVMAGLLALRESIHGLVKGMTETELRSALILLAMTFIVLPIAPNDAIGPFGGINPRQVWLVAIVLAGVSFAGYAAVKYFGAQHGGVIAAIAGGLASSTAVTVTNARRAGAGEGHPRLLAAGVSLASAVSFGRVLAIVTAVNPLLLMHIAPALVAAAAVSVGIGLLWTYRQTPEAGEEPTMTLRNPFSFWSVMGFAVLLVGMILVGRVLAETLGTGGVFVGALVLGLADVDAVTVSMSGLAPRMLTERVAADAILLAVASNSLSKLALAASIGRGWFAVQVAGAMLACLAVGVVARYAAPVAFAAAGLV